MKKLLLMVTCLSCFNVVVFADEGVDHKKCHEANQERQKARVALSEWIQSVVKSGAPQGDGTKELASFVEAAKAAKAACK